MSRKSRFKNVIERNCLIGHDDIEKKLKNIKFECGTINSMKTAVVQAKSNIGKFQENFQKIFEIAGRISADVFVFPELFLSGYTLDERILREGAKFLSANLKNLVKLSREKDAMIIFGAPRIVGKSLRNSAVVIRKKREVLFYDKTHLFRKEKEIFEPGEDFLVFDFKGVRFGVLLCYEIGFPEISRILTLRGAQVLISLFAFGRERWRIYDTATKARAIENGSFLISSSTTGKGLMDFIGKSRVVHPSGEVLSQLDDEEGILTTDIDVSVLDHYRYEEMGDSHAYFVNRKADMYKDICF